MSVPFGLTISNGNCFDMSRAAVVDLYDYLEPLFMDNWRDDNNPDKDYAGCFTGMFFGSIMPFSHLPAAEYRQACQWVDEAVDKLDSLKPYKSDLTAALQADPRYKTA